MSLRNIKLGCLIIIFGLACGWGISQWHDSVPRRIASTGPFPSPKVNLWGHSPKGKLNQSIDVRIESIDGIPDSDDQDLRLVAYVTLNRPIDKELNYRWNLPAGASIVSGELEDSWPAIQPGQTASVEISLQGISREGLAKTVTLQIYGTSNGVQYANSGSFTTDPRDLASSTDEELALLKKKNIEKMEKAHQ